MHQRIPYNAFFPGSKHVAHQLIGSIRRDQEWWVFKGGQKLPPGCDPQPTNALLEELITMGLLGLLIKNETNGPLILMWEISCSSYVSANVHEIMCYSILMTFLLF